MMRRAQPWLGTLVDVTLADRADDETLRKAFDCGFAEIGRVHQLMSFHEATSDVSRINHAQPGEALVVHRHTYNVLRIAETIKEVSNGAFNIACAPCLVEWGHLPAPGAPVPKYVPDQAIFQLKGDGSVVKLSDGWIDLGGIAKGYAVDLAIGALRAAGVRNACVNAGGDLRVLGEKAFAIALRDPKAPTQVRQEIFLQDEAMATSATYFSGKHHDGQSTSALCDGLSGRPIVAPVSVSVRASLCVIADGLTKVVLSTANPEHPALRLFRATAFML
jgi:thiamine biosynthesis lipoprotein